MPMVQQAGHDYYHTGGAKWLPPIQIAYILSTLRHSDGISRAVYDDNEHRRLRRHVLLTGRRGLGKSSCSSIFLNHLTPTKNIVRAEPDEDVPLLLNVCGQGLTWARIRGGATGSGSPIFPLLQRAHYIYAPELMDFIGHNPAVRSDRIEVLNTILEEGKVTVGLNKMFDASEKKVKQFAEECEELGIRYNVRERMMDYDVHASFIGATRPLIGKDLEEADTSGFLSRLDVNDWNPNEKEAKALHRRGFGKIAQWRDDILAFNTAAWNTTWGFVPDPDMSILQEIVEWMWEVALDDIVQKFHHEVLDVVSMRDHTDIAQLITAKAAMRTLEDRYAAGKTAGNVPELQYVQEDIEWVKRYLQPMLQDRYEHFLRLHREAPTNDDDMNLMLRFMEHNRGSSVFSSDDLIDFIASDRSIKTSSARNKFTVLKKGDLFHRTGNVKEYRASQKVLDQLPHMHLSAEAGYAPGEAPWE